MAGDDQNSDNQLFVEHLDPPEPLELSFEPALGYPPPDPLFKTTVSRISSSTPPMFGTKIRIE